MRHFDVQMIGGIVLHRGKIAEMKTGEGKTLVATLPVYLNALEGRGVHVVTVNDYLARRDAEWMGRLYRFLGLSVGVILHGLNDRERQEALQRGRHLRAEQRVRLRLPARQHEVRARGLRAAHVSEGSHRRAGQAVLEALQLRDRRRGRLDSDRRGPDAADHLRSRRGLDREVLRHRPGDPTAPEGGRFHRRREDAERHPHRGRHRQDREGSRHRQSLRSGRNRYAPPREPGAARPCHLQARRRLRGEGRRGADRRRVHRSPHAGPALERRAPPGGRGEGGRQDRA